MEVAGLKEVPANSTALRQAPNEFSTTFSAANLTWISQRLQAGELSKPGPELDDFTRKLLVGLWLETLAEIGAERFDAAFKQVLRSSSFRPDIAEIRKAAGINRGIEDPTEKQALSELRMILCTMRLHGPELKPIVGRIVQDRDERGCILQVPVRAPNVPAPQLEERTESAIVEVGMGSRGAGLEFLACHPALPWNSVKLQQEDAIQRAFKVKNAGEIEKRWVQAWAGVR